jgi:hypothetical protein
MQIPLLQILRHGTFNDSHHGARVIFCYACINCTDAPMLNQALDYEGKRGIHVEPRAFLTSAPDGGDWSASRPSLLPPFLDVFNHEQ